MSSAGASDYDDRHAAVYDRLYGGRFASAVAVAVAALAAAAGDHGTVLELGLGLGTGRLAIPLVQRGLVVDGIEGSPAMVDRLRQRPGGDRVGRHDHPRAVQRHRRYEMPSRRRCATLLR